MPRYPDMIPADQTRGLPDCRTSGPVALPSRRRAGIDEAGYGPLLGPLAIGCAAAEVMDAAGFAAEVAALGVDDSKALHDPGNLAPLETVALGALTWLTGSAPAQADAVFALLGETAAARADLPWMAGAEHLRLPVAAASIPVWAMGSARPLGLSGALIHPLAMNAARAGGRNRAQLEWDAIGSLMAMLAAHGPVTITCDRLGGRRYYGDPLASVFPWCPITVESETAPISRYTVAAERGIIEIAFVVGGERADPLVAIASCVAKYARELHGLLFNAWWSARCPGLRPTAGYGSDAHRWLADIPPADRRRWQRALVRGGS